MDYRFLIKTLKNIIFNPSNIWEYDISEKEGIKLIRNSFLLPLLILISLSAFFGSLIFANSEMPLSYSVFTSVKWFLILYISLLTSTFIIGEITFPLDLGRDYYVSFRLVAFSFTPFMICLIFSRLFESILFVNILGLYGIYIFWTGMEKLINPPQYKKIPLLTASLLSIVVIYSLTNILLNMIFNRIFFTFFD